MEDEFTQNYRAKHKVYPKKIWSKTGIIIIKLKTREKILFDRPKG